MPNWACESPEGLLPRTCNRSLRARREAFRKLRALQSGVGRHRRYFSITGSGMSIQRWVETSCSIRFMGKTGARSSGPTGLPVPGCSGGLIGVGMSDKILYHCLGISLSCRTTFICSIFFFLLLVLIDFRVLSDVQTTAAQKQKGRRTRLKKLNLAPRPLNVATGLMWTGSPKSLPPPHHQRIFKNGSPFISLMVNTNFAHSKQIRGCQGKNFGGTATGCFAGNFLRIRQGSPMLSGQSELFRAGHS